MMVARQTIESVTRQTLSQPIYFSRAVWALFAVAWIAMMIRVLGYFAAAGGLTEAAGPGFLLRGVTCNWFAAVLLALAALLSFHIARYSARVADYNTWILSSFFLVLLSAAQVAEFHAFLAVGLSVKPYFISQPAAMALIIVLPAVWMLLRLRRALFESDEAAGMLLLGAFFLTSGSLGRGLLAYYHGRAILGGLWPIEIFFYEAAVMAGAIMLLAGFVRHEKYLFEQRRRAESGRISGTLPTPKTGTAEWALKMIGTPTAANPESDHPDICVARNRRRDDPKQAFDD